MKFATVRTSFIFMHSVRKCTQFVFMWLVFQFDFITPTGCNRYQEWLMLHRQWGIVRANLGLKSDLQDIENVDGSITTIEDQAWTIQFTFNDFVETYVRLFGSSKVSTYISYLATGVFVNFYCNHGSVEKLQAQGNEGTMQAQRTFCTTKVNPGGNCGRNAYTNDDGQRILTIDPTSTEGKRLYEKYGTLDGICPMKRSMYNYMAIRAVFSMETYLDDHIIYEGCVEKGRAFYNKVSETFVRLANRTSICVLIRFLLNYVPAETT